MAKNLQLVIVTGMSGAGKTVTMQSFEDLGYFVVDNMPPALLPKFFELVTEAGNIEKVALVVDLRSRTFYDQLLSMLTGDRRFGQDVDTEILFLDASDEELIARYKETRRAHPLAMDGRIADGVRKERELLAPLKTDSQFIIDTTKMTPRELREKIFAHFSDNKTAKFHVEILSFGYKYGLPIDADIVMDVRFLPNPYYIPELRNHTGMDKDVYDYVMNQPATAKFYEHFIALLKETLPGYEKEGKSNLTIAIGCTGGQHRSVAIAERLGSDLKDIYPTHVQHRDALKRKETVNRS